ncbi:MAG: cytochrome c3 family protein [Planctomycetes bacterium]|nr:cytochrome c3 family protein [Planctomycetota bacterium]
MADGKRAGGAGGIALAALAAVVLIAGASDPGSDAGEKAKPDKYAGSCVREGCHKDLVSRKVIHGPLEDNDCETCHERAAGEHHFTFVAEKQELCEMCHEIPPRQKVVHKPILDGGCTDCHDPHSGPQKALLRAKTVAAQCASCHTLAEAKHPHEPSAEGECLACHHPHQSENADLLMEPEPRICLGCHTGTEEELQEKHVHRPCAEGCSSCHASHGGPEAHLLREPFLPLCLKCHVDVRGAMAGGPVQHGALLSRDACMNCHQPHGGNLTYLLKDASKPLCLKCHDEEQKTPDGKTLKNIGKLLEESNFLHGPIRESDCTACHSAHGSTNFRMLRLHFPQSFYEAFDIGKYALCFRCHASALVLTKRTESLTMFRDGDINLHYLHVNDKVKGRSCRACHPVHASNRPKHIRESVPFGKGNWLLPINFRKTETGGSCAPGCHDPKSYDNSRRAAR